MYLMTSIYCVCITGKFINLVTTVSQILNMLTHSNVFVAASSSHKDVESFVESMR